jgi:hypothetical protein
MRRFGCVTWRRLEWHHFCCDLFSPNLIDVACTGLVSLDMPAGGIRQQMAFGTGPQKCFFHRKQLRLASVGNGPDGMLPSGPSHYRFAAICLTGFLIARPLRILLLTLLSALRGSVSMRKERIVRKELVRAPIGSWRGPSPDFLHKAPNRFVCAAFSRESCALGRLDRLLGRRGNGAIWQTGPLGPDDVRRGTGRGPVGGAASVLRRAFSPAKAWDTNTEHCRQRPSVGIAWRTKLHVLPEKEPR